MRSHAEICTELSGKYRELAAVECLELRARVHAWNSSGESATAREQYARAASADFTADVIDLKGDIRALEYELRAVEWAVTHAD